MYFWSIFSSFLTLCSGEGNGNPLRYCCLGNPMDRGASGGLQSTGSQRLGRDWATDHARFLFRLQGARTFMQTDFLWSLLHRRMTAASVTQTDASSQLLRSLQWENTLFFCFPKERKSFLGNSVEKATGELKAEGFWCTMETGDFRNDPTSVSAACFGDHSELTPCSTLDSSWASLAVHLVKNPPAIQETQVQSLGQEDPLEKGMATHSSIPAWRIPWTEEPGGL